MYINKITIFTTLMIKDSVYCIDVEVKQNVKKRKVQLLVVNKLKSVDFGHFYVMKPQVNTFSWLVSKVECSYLIDITGSLAKSANILPDFGSRSCLKLYSNYWLFGFFTGQSTTWLFTLKLLHFITAVGIGLLENVIINLWKKQCS